MSLAEVIEAAKKEVSEWPVWLRYQTDARYRAVWDRLSKLTEEQLQLIIDNIDRVCFDTFNYDEKHKTFCPLAIAHGLDALHEPTDAWVSEILSLYYQPVNILKGVPGEFYTTNRRADLLAICELLLKLHRGPDKSLPK